MNFHVLKPFSYAWVSFTKIGNSRKWSICQTRFLLPMHAKTRQKACLMILMVIVLKSRVLTLASTNDPKYNSVFFSMTQDRGHENIVILCSIIAGSLLLFTVLSVFWWSVVSSLWVCLRQTLPPAPAPPPPLCSGRTTLALSCISQLPLSWKPK